MAKFKVHIALRGATSGVIDGKGFVVYARDEFAAGHDATRTFLNWACDHSLRDGDTYQVSITDATDATDATGE